MKIQSTALAVPTDVLEMILASGLIITNEAAGGPQANNVQALRDRLAEQNELALTIQATADAAHRDFTAEENEQLDACFAEIDRVTNEIRRRDLIQANTDRMAQAQGRRSEPGDPETGQPTNQTAGAPRAHTTHAQARSNDGRHGFRNMGDFARNVVAACRPGGHVDPRLTINAATTFGSEGVGADGGFAVPPDFRQTIEDLIQGEDALLPRCDLMETSSNTLVLPKDETTPWQSTGGIQAYWENEAAQIAQSKPALGENTIRLNKLAALVPVTNELLEDAAALTSYIGRKAPERINFKINLALVQGTGAGQPLGFLNSPALITVAEESAQTANTIVFANITKMYSRLYGPSRATSVWMVSQDVESQLYGMQFPGTGTAVPVFLPPGQLSSTPYATLMGRPVVTSQAMNHLGVKGDIALVDWKQYLAAQKVGGIRSEMSIHLYFDYDLTAFRFIVRIAGQPWRSAPIVPRDASASTLSSFVTLADRP